MKEVDRMEVQGILIDGIDQAVTVTQQVRKGDLIIIRTDEGIETIQANEDIPQFHKSARTAIQKGEIVYKYGQKIGIAVADIERGSWIHTHNLKSESML